MKLNRSFLLASLCAGGLWLGTLPACTKKAKDEGGGADEPAGMTPRKAQGAATHPETMGPRHDMATGRDPGRPMGHHDGMGNGDTMGHGPQAGQAPHWGYAGDTGPAHWGDLSPEFAACKTGKAQSPVDISKPAKAKSAPLQFAYQASTVALVDNGHSIQWKIQPSSTMTAGGTAYVLKQVHFHAPSEHTVEGKAFVAEAHFVHQAADGKLAVVGVLFEVGAENPVLAKLWSAFPLKRGHWVTLKDSALDPTGLLPKARLTWRYPGSLTTPPCTEGLSWFVIRTPQTLSEDQLKAFQAIHPGSARPVQPLHGRTVVAGG